MTEIQKLQFFNDCCAHNWLVHVASRQNSQRCSNKIFKLHRQTAIETFKITEDLGKESYLLLVTIAINTWKMKKM